MLVEIEYTNYKNRRAVRKIRPEPGGLHWQEGNQYHPEPQWLLFAVDLEDGKLKTWAMNKVHSWKTIGR